MGTLIAMHKALGGGSGGGGSSGGGVLVVHETVTATSEDATIHTLDKTWQEIHDADFAVLKTDDGMIYYAFIVGADDGGYYVGFMYDHPAEDGYFCDSASGYPSYTQHK